MANKRTYKAVRWAASKVHITLQVQRRKYIAAPVLLCTGKELNEERGAAEQVQTPVDADTMCVSCRNTAEQVCPELLAVRIVLNDDSNEADFYRGAAVILGWMARSRWKREHRA